MLKVLTIMTICAGIALAEDPSDISTLQPAFDKMQGDSFQQQAEHFPTSDQKIEKLTETEDVTSDGICYELVNYQSSNSSTEKDNSETLTDNKE